MKDTQKIQKVYSFLSSSMEKKLKNRSTKKPIGWLLTNDGLKGW